MWVQSAYSVVVTIASIDVLFWDRRWNVAMDNINRYSSNYPRFMYYFVFLWSSSHFVVWALWAVNVSNIDGHSASFLLVSMVPPGLAPRMWSEKREEEIITITIITKKTSWWQLIYEGCFWDFIAKGPASMESWEPPQICHWNEWMLWIFILLQSSRFAILILKAPFMGALVGLMWLLNVLQRAAMCLSIV